MAHVGIIQAFLENNIPIDYIAGTSMGAIIGGWYAATDDIYDIKDAFSKLKKGDVYSIQKVFKRRDGVLFRNSSFLKELEEKIKGMRVEKCKIPFRAVATDLKNGNAVVLKEGSLDKTLHASSAVPMVFKPIKIGNKELIDGGYSNPVPADVVRKMGADVVIGGDVSGEWFDFSKRNKFSLRDVPSVLNEALSAVEYQLARPVLEEADIVIRPLVTNYFWLDFGNADTIIRAGYDEITLNLKKIRKAAGLHAPDRTPIDKLFDFLFGQ